MPREQYPPPVAIILVHPGTTTKAEDGGDTRVAVIRPRWITMHDNGSIDVGLDLSDPILREAMKREGMQ